MLVIALCMACFFRAKINKNFGPLLWMLWCRHWYRQSWHFSDFTPAIYIPAGPEWRSKQCCKHYRKGRDLSLPALSCLQLKGSWVKPLATSCHITRQVRINARAWVRFPIEHSSKQPYLLTIKASI